MAKYVLYKNQKVSVNTDLAELLEKGEHEKAEKHWSNLNKEYNKYWPSELKYLQNWCVGNLKML